MRVDEIKETTAWGLYEHGRNYHRLTKIYADTDLNYRMYNGNQWEGAKLGSIEPVQKNIIKPIVKYKVGVIHDNLYAINYSSQNYENKDFRKQAEKICAMLNKRASRIWEKDKLDFLGRRITKDAAINDEGIMYVMWDAKTNMPVNEIVKKNDIYYGNENDDDIQKQPYILIRKRLPVTNAIEIALNEGLSENEIDCIIGDNDTFEESGVAAKEEVHNMVTMITKMWKENGTVHFSMSTRWVDIKKNKDSGLKLYPVAHLNWEEKEGSARGEGEVRCLIPNQIEINRTEMRRVLTVKEQAYPHKVANMDKIINPSALNTVGGVIKVHGANADDVNKIVTTLHPAQMSSDVVKLQEDLIQVTRDLAGAGDIATGQVNPEDASGRAILAVQQASQSPMTEQKESFKNFTEDLARIWLDMIITYSQEGIKLEEEIADPSTGETSIEIVGIPQASLEELMATVKVDITPKGAFDKYAQEISIENMFQAGMFNVQKLQELKVYVSLLDDDSVMPKGKLEDAIELMEQEQKKIAMINAEAQMMKQRAQQFLMSDSEAQSSQIAEAMVNDEDANAQEETLAEADESEEIEI